MSLANYIVKRSIITLAMFFLMLNVNFFLFEFLPVDVLGWLHGTYSPFPDMAAQFGIFQPWYVQYVKYIQNTLTGNFGRCVSHPIDFPPTLQPCDHQYVWSLIKNYVPNTVFLIVVSVTIAVVIGVLTGALAAAKQGKVVDRGILSSATFSYALPGFWIGTLFFTVLAQRLGLFPTSLLSAAQILSANTYGGVLSYLWSAALPIATMVLVTFGSFTLVVRFSMSGTLEIPEEYIMMARAKGLSERKVIFSHSLRNSLLPLLNSTVIAFGIIMTNDILVERIFSFPGLGLVLLGFIQFLDFPVINVVFLFLASFLLLGNFIVDIVSAIIDPRIRYDLTLKSGS